MKSKGISIGLFSCAATLLISSLPCVVLAAAGHEEPEVESAFTLLMRTVNFILLAGLLYYLLNKPIKNFLSQRQRTVKASLEEAERARQQAEQKYKEVERKLVKAKEEMEELRKMLIEQGRTEKDKIIAGAKEEAEKIRKQAHITVEQEYKKAQYALRAEAVELAARMAEAILRERMGPDDHKRLIKDYIESVGKTM